MTYFEKYQATGNDFILIKEQPNNPSQFAKSVCDRHFGIGADGIMYPSASMVADIKMNYFNSDGSIAPMCGNGMRSFVSFVYRHQLVQKTEFTVETKAGLISVVLDPKTNESQIDLGKPIFLLGLPDLKIPQSALTKHQLTIHQTRVSFYVLNLGTLHTIVYLDENPKMDMDVIGPQLTHHPFFPQQTNVNFVEVIDHSQQKVKTHERGAGWTLSCGTGVAASGALSALLGKTESIIETIVDGGNLTVYAKDTIQLRGPAILIASGTLEESLQ